MQLTFSNRDIVKAPYQKENSLVFEYRARSLILMVGNNFNSVFAKMMNRLCEDSLLEEGIFQYQKLDIPLFGGEAKSRGFRFMTNIGARVGSYQKDNE